MKVKSIITVILVILLACIGLVLSVGQKIVLVAENDIVIWNSPAINLSQANQIGQLKAGEHAPVSACIDIKHYYVPEIVLPAGEKGYVVDGKFRLNRYPFWQRSKGHLVFSCRAITGQ